MDNTPPPPDAAGTLPIVQLGDKGTSKIALMIVANSTATADLLMETLLLAFNRADVVQITQELTTGIDYSDPAVRKERPLLPRPGEAP